MLNDTDKYIDSAMSIPWCISSSPAGEFGFNVEIAISIISAGMVCSWIILGDTWYKEGCWDTVPTA